VAETFHSIVKVRIIITFVQMLHGVGITFAVPYPPTYATVLNFASSVVQLDLPTAMPLGCMMSVDFTTRLVLRTLLPLIAMLLLFVSGRVVNRFGYGHLGGLLSASWFYILFLVYPSCSSAAFQTFICDTLESGKEKLRVDYSVTCWEDEHLRAVAYALVMVVIYPLGTPLLYSSLLYANHEQLERIRRVELRAMAEDTKLDQHRLSTSAHHWDVHKEATDGSMMHSWTADSDVPQEAVDVNMIATIEANKAAREEAEKLRGELSPIMQELTDGYEMRCYWFESFECVRKIMLVGLPVFLPMGSPEQLVIGLLLCFTSSMVYSAFAPFLDVTDDRVASSCNVCLFFALVSSIVLKMERNSSSGVMDVLLLIAMMLPAVLVFLLQSDIDCGSWLCVSRLQARVFGFFRRTVGSCIVKCSGQRTTVPSPATLQPEVLGQQPKAQSESSPSKLAWVSGKFGASLWRSHLADMSPDVPTPAQRGASCTRRRISRMLDRPPTMRGMRKKPSKNSFPQPQQLPDTRVGPASNAPAANTGGHRCTPSLAAEECGITVNDRGSLLVDESTVFMTPVLPSSTTNARPAANHSSALTTQTV